MVDITVTAANVDAGTNGRIGTGKAGVAITAGKVVYFDRVNRDYRLADADVEASAKAAGVAVCDAAAGQIVSFQIDGTYAAGATVTVGALYAVSVTAGGIAPIADLGSGDFVTVLGIGATATEIKLGIWATGVAKA
jgi:hypothetical protein